MTLDEELDRIFTVRDRNNMQPTIDALLPILAEHPADARVLYEVGGAYDTAGKEQAARSFYEQAIPAGLSGDLLRRCYVQYGSTLRNLGEFARSVKVFERARQDFPDSPSLAVFQASSLHAFSRFDEAVAALLEVVAEGVESPDIERCKPSIRGNAAHIRSLATSAQPAKQHNAWKGHGQGVGSLRCKTTGFHRGNLERHGFGPSRRVRAGLASRFTGEPREWRQRTVSGRRIRKFRDRQDLLVVKNFATPAGG